MNRVVKRILAGEGRMEDLNLIVDVANRIEGHTICALGDAAGVARAELHQALPPRIRIHDRTQGPQHGR